MELVKIRKGQVRKLKNDTETFDVSIRIPIEYLYLLGWKEGDMLIVTADKNKGELKARKKED